MEAMLWLVRRVYFFTHPELFLTLTNMETHFSKFFCNRIRQDGTILLRNSKIRIILLFLILYILTGSYDFCRVVTTGVLTFFGSKNDSAPALLHSKYCTTPNSWQSETSYPLWLLVFILKICSDQILAKFMDQGGCCCSFLIETSRKNLQDEKNFLCLEIAEIDMGGQFWAEKNDSGHKNPFFEKLSCFPGLNSRIWSLIHFFRGRFCDVISL